MQGSLYVYVYYIGVCESRGNPHYSLDYVIVYYFALYLE